MARFVPAQSQQDVIVSRATAAGDGAIAIVRLSGPNSHAIAERLFTPRDGKRLDPSVPGQLILGTLATPAGGREIIDECFVVFWRGPKSYTGEDMAEFQLHGAVVVVDQCIHACIEAGARMATPGEFTRRAYLNGKMDLVQAEAVCDLIRAQTDAAGRAALVQLAGGLSRRIALLRDELVPVVAELEAHIDFPEEGLEFSTRERLGRAVDHAIRALQAMLDSAGRGRHLREGARVVLAGPPNAGKSSLFNLLLGRERALVTPHPGTTRDTIEAQIDLDGYPVTLVDTAGLRAAHEEVEALGIERTHTEIRGAGMVIFLVDQQAAGEALAEYEAVRDAPHLLVFNKADLPEKAGDFPLNAPGLRGRFRISVKTRAGIEELERALLEWLGGAPEVESGLVTNRRHAEALARALNPLHTAAEGLASELSPEFILVDLAESISALDSITGRQSLDEDVLDAIFSTFCLGK